MNSLFGRTLPRAAVVWIFILALATLSLAPTVALGEALADAQPAPVAQEQELVWERFDVAINVHDDGTFDVSEQQTINFTRGSFTRGARDIPKRNLGSIGNWSITDASGNEYALASSGERPYTFTVEDYGTYYQIYWYIPRAENFQETYTINYTVDDGLRFYEGGDQVWWTAIFSDRPFPVLAGEVRVTVPERAAVQEWAAYVNERDASNVATAEVLANEGTVVFALNELLSAGEAFEVRVEFTPDVVVGAPADWQQRADAEVVEREEAMAFRNRWGPVASLAMLATALAILFGGPALLYLLWYTRGRDKPTEMVADYLPEPPSDLPPGLAGTLLDETVDMEDILATLVDLAERKAISITEDKEEGFFRKSTDFIYRRERDDVELLDYEDKLLDEMFGRKQEVRLSDLKDKFYDKLPGIRRSMYRATVEQGLFPGDPDKTRTAYFGLGFGLIIVSVVLMVTLLGLLSNLTPLAALPGVALGVSAIGLIILARFMPRKTDKGTQAASRWKAFKTYLANIDQYADMEAQKPIWDRYLPYAIAFGIDKQYIRKFENVDAPAPGWYIPTPSAYGGYRRGYYGTPGRRRGAPVFFPTGGMGGMGGMGGGSRGGMGDVSPGGTLSDMSRGMGGSLTAMSAGLGTMLAGASTTMTSRPASTSSSGGGWSGGGGGFSGGGSFGGGGGGGGGGGFS